MTFWIRIFLEQISKRSVTDRMKQGILMIEDALFWFNDL